MKTFFLLASQSGVSAEIPVLESAPPAAIPEETTTAVVSVNALSTPLNDFTVTEFLLLLIFVLLCADFVLKLFVRKCGFPEW